MSKPNVIADDYGLYRCDLCGQHFNRDEVSEIRDMLNLNGRIVISYRHICDGCNSVECDKKGKTIEREK